MRALHSNNCSFSGNQWESPRALILKLALITMIYLRSLLMGDWMICADVSVERIYDCVLTRWLLTSCMINWCGYVKCILPKRLRFISTSFYELRLCNTLASDKYKMRQKFLCCFFFQNNRPKKDLIKLKLFSQIRALTLLR